MIVILISKRGASNPLQAAGSTFKFSWPMGLEVLSFQGITPVIPKESDFDPRYSRSLVLSDMPSAFFLF